MITGIFIPFDNNNIPYMAIKDLSEEVKDVLGYTNYIISTEYGNCTKDGVKE